jgi:hypothetical protein
MTLASQFSVSDRVSPMSWHPQIDDALRRTSRPGILTLGTEVRSCSVDSIGEFDSVADVAFMQQGARYFMSSGRTAWPNTSVEPTAYAVSFRTVMDSLAMFGVSAPRLPRL